MTMTKGDPFGFALIKTMLQSCAGYYDDYGGENSWH